MNTHCAASLTVLLFLSAVPASFTVAQDKSVYNGHRDHSIPVDKAARLVKNFRAGKEEGAVVGEYFGLDALMSLLTQPGCTGMRIYYGKTDAGKPVLVLVGVNGEGHDMTAGVINEIGSLCPPICDESESLLREESSK